MNYITILDNISGNIISDSYYKFSNDNIYDLCQDDYKQVAICKNQISLCFPLGINGIISPIYVYKCKSNFNIKQLILIVREYYGNKITCDERELLEEQSKLDVSNYTYRKELLELTNLCYFQGLEHQDDIYYLNLGS